MFVVQTFENIPILLKLSLFFNTHRSRLIYVCYCSTWNCMIPTAVSLGNIKDYMVENLKIMPPTNNKTILKTTELQIISFFFSIFVHCWLPQYLIMDQKHDTYIKMFCQSQMLCFIKCFIKMFCQYVQSLKSIKT